jgi:hypothetical protein
VFIIRNTLFFIFLLSSIELFSQIEPFIIPLKDSNVSRKKSVSIINTSWKLSPKGLQSVMLTVNKNDTIFYTVSRTRKRQATFSVWDLNAALIKQTFPPNVHIISNGFVANQDGSLILMLKNHSFLSNALSLDIQKKEFIPKNTEKDPDPIIIPTNYIYSDSLVVLLDTIVYLACKLNLNQPNSFSIPVPSASFKTYNMGIEQTITNISIENSYIKPNGDVKTNKLNISCEDKNTVSSAKGSIIIYLQKPNKNSTFLDSLANSILLKNQFCKGLLNTFATSHNLIISNQDKVVGKHVHIQLVEIKNNRKPVVWNDQ